MTRDELIDAYVERVIDDMDMDVLVAYASDCLSKGLYTLSNDDLRSEIGDDHPDLVEEFNQTH